MQNWIIRISSKNHQIRRKRPWFPVSLWDLIASAELQVKIWNRIRRRKSTALTVQGEGLWQANFVRREHKKNRNVLLWRNSPLNVRIVHVSVVRTVNFEFTSFYCWCSYYIPYLIFYRYSTLHILFSESFVNFGDNFLGTKFKMSATWPSSLVDYTNFRLQSNLETNKIFIFSFSVNIRCTKDAWLRTVLE